MSEIVDDSVTDDNNIFDSSKIGCDGTPFLSPKFDEKNFIVWSQSCLLALKCNRMIKYVNGIAKKPKESHPSFDDWDCENASVMLWLLNSMEFHIRKRYLFFDTAENLWNSIAQTYSYPSKMANLFEVEQKVWALTLEGRTLNMYYSELTSLWLELDHYTMFVCKHVEDQEKYQKMVMMQRVMKFLAGLPNEYDSIKNQLIS